MDLFSADIQEFILSQDDEIDALLAAALDYYESGQDNESSCANLPASQPLPPFCAQKSRFAEPKTDREIQKARNAGIPQKDEGRHKILC